MKKMDKEMKNSQAIYDLVQEIQKQKSLMMNGVIINFTPYILYEHNGTEDRERLNVEIKHDTYNYGDIEISEGNTLKNDTHHLGFSSRYQDYQYDDVNKIFIVSGKSPKMGNYKVSFLLDENI